MLRKKFILVKSAEPVLARNEDVETAKQIVELTREVDARLFEISRLKAKLMERIGDHSDLRTENGVLIAIWAPGKTSKCIDYDAMIREFKVSEDWIRNHTTLKNKGRALTISDNL